MDTLYTLTESVELRLFPLGYRTLFNLVKEGERKKLGEDVEDYVLAQDIGKGVNSRWVVSEDELADWLRRRQAMKSRKGLMKPKKNSAML